MVTPAERRSIEHTSGTLIAERGVRMGNMARFECSDDGTEVWFSSCSFRGRFAIQRRLPWDDD